LTGWRDLEHIWSRIGTEDDAYLQVDKDGVSANGFGLADRSFGPPLLRGQRCA
jgi:hypothetical protein